MIILIGPSASGKTVAAKNLQEKYNLKKAITTTTRKMRINETDGVDYFFLTRKEFLKEKKNDKFVETTLYNNNFYGCRKDQVDDNKIIILDPNGLHSFLKLNNPRIVSFFIKCDENIRKERMIARGDDITSVNERLENNQIEFSDEKISHIDFVIHSDELSLNDMTDKIYNLYINKLNELK